MPRFTQQLNINQLIQFSLIILEENYRLTQELYKSLSPAASGSVATAKRPDIMSDLAFCHATPTSYQGFRNLFISGKFGLDVDDALGCGTLGLDALDDDDYDTENFQLILHIASGLGFNSQVGDFFVDYNSGDCLYDVTYRSDDLEEIAKMNHWIERAIEANRRIRFL